MPLPAENAHLEIWAADCVFVFGSFLSSLVLPQRILGGQYLCELQRESQSDAKEEEIFENERFLPIKGWGNSLPTERKRYSTRDGSQSAAEFPSLPLPQGDCVCQ